MRQITCWTCLLLVVLSLVAVRNVAACSCRADHPQTKFCLADYVATVRVKSERHEREQINYKVKVNKMFKSNAEAEVILKEKGLWTPSSDSMCGVRLNVGETYVISGHITSGEARLSICDISIRWSTVNRRHRKDFKWFYHHGCVCKIRYTPWWHKGIVLETEGGKQCLWESTPGPQSCQEQYGVCMAGPSGCSWYPSTPYKNCIKEYQRRRELQRSLEP